MLTVEIHPLYDDELILVEHFLPKPQHPTIHANRLSRQKTGQVIYLIAWRDNMPLGHLLIDWNGASDAFVRERVVPSPYLEDMHVLEEFRSLEVGSQLIDVAESLILEEGYSTYSLAVAIDNDRAIALYKKHGFIESDIGTYIISGTSMTDDNTLVRWEAESCYMTKNLP